MSTVALVQKYRLPSAVVNLDNQQRSLELDRRSFRWTWLRPLLILGTNLVQGYCFRESVSWLFLLFAVSGRRLHQLQYPQVIRKLTV
jgi:hypothetical protein